jgi:hypothetical protein
MKKQVLIAFAVWLCLTVNIWAQVPSYAPTNGLVGYWPFNGNANDESGNGNNGTVNGAALTTDRFGVANKAYSFDGVNDLILLPADLSTYTISLWFNFSNLTNPFSEIYFYEDGSNSIVQNGNYIYIRKQNQSIASVDLSTSSISPNVWHHIVVNYNFNLNTFDCKIDNSLVFSSNNTSGGASNNINDNIFQIGGRQFNNTNFLHGFIDDIGIWNRALNDCEIQDLYNAQLNSVTGSISVSPQPATIGSSVLLSTASQTQNVQWQTAPAALNWQNVPNNANYSGGTTNTLTVSNVQLSNHNQPFRVIANAGNCTDTSNVASIQIADTCITNVTVYDTLYTTVTDTLIINTTLSLPAPNNENTILIYPNQASDHITIDNGNFAAMAGYSIKIENNAGQQVFQNTINQAQFYVDLSTWTGNGLYFVHLIDAQGNTVTVRKIVLQ